MAGPVMEFWFEFDNAFNPAFGQVADDIADAEDAAGPVTGLWRVAMPREDATDNPRLPEARLQTLRQVWLPMSVEQLDSAFDSKPFPPAALIDPVP